MFVKVGHCNPSVREIVKNNLKRKESDSTVRISTIQYFVSNNFKKVLVDDAKNALDFIEELRIKNYLKIKAMKEKEIEELMAAASAMIQINKKIR